MLYFLIMAGAVALVLGAGKPILDRMRDKSVFYEMKDSFTAIDKQIEDIASEGPGSQRVIPLDVRRGKLVIEDDKLRWEMETNARLMEPRSKMELGNLIVASEIDVTTTQTSAYYLLSNSYIQANVSRYGNQTNQTTVNTSLLINWIKVGDDKIAGTFDFMIAGDSTTQNGTGWTELKQAGSSMATGSLVTHMQTSNYDYDLLFTLDSKADFLTVTIENLEAK